MSEKQGHMVCARHDVQNWMAGEVFACGRGLAGWKEAAEC
jgi:hypothetical protein